MDQCHAGETSGDLMGRFMEKLGHGAARLWRWILLMDRRVQTLLVQKGWPKFTMKALLFSVRASLVCLLAYGAFWLFVLLCGIWIAAWSIQNHDWEDSSDVPKWRYGAAGYGLYQDEIRIDWSDEDETD
jgi:hypothetical protein